MKKGKISFFATVMTIAIGTSVFAAAPKSLIDTSKKGSLTITTQEKANGSTSVTGNLEGVEYTLYPVVETVDTTAAAETAIVGATATATKTTGTDGVAKFENLTLGRYYAKVTNVPEGTNSVPQSFLVDIPRTNDAGDGWNYDVTAFPKVSTSTGSIIVKKENNAGQAQNGVKFKVQYQLAGTTTWTDLTGATELTTATNGTVAFNNLPKTMEGKEVTYRVIETQGKEGYIVDNSVPAAITINDNGETVIDGQVKADKTLTITNEIPTVDKKVATTGDPADTVNAGATDTLTFTITNDVPTMIAKLATFTLKDTLPTGIKAVTASDVTVKALANGTESTLTAGTDYTITVSGKVVTIAFDPTKLDGKDTVITTYTTKLDSATAELTNTNTAELTYSVSTDAAVTTTNTIDDDAEVTTGSLKIKKVDTAAAPLAGAKFKIATTEANAKAGTFMTDSEGTEIEVTSAVDGYATINALADGTYYLVETESPTYVDENGETQHYLLLNAPKAVEVNSATEVEVVNKKQTVLPLTGGIGSAIFVLLGMVFIMLAKSIKKEVKE